MRDRGDIQGLKKIAYGRGAKSGLAIYALIDLGALDISVLGDYRGGNISTESIYDDEY
ncbi:MAG: hypothetical protein U9O98_00010 [Asgard group archaeon]|nr:hypothetical protein [Asgard group archaeon]